MKNNLLQLFLEKEEENVGQVSLQNNDILYSL